MRKPRFIVAAACGMAAYAMMNMVMTSAPLAMVGCGHSVTDATLGIQWHVLAMYAPSFVTGGLIARFGVGRIAGLGLALIALTAGIGMAGVSIAHFWTALILLGIGWNFAFIGATTMVTECHRLGRAQQGAGVQRLPDLRQHGGRLVLVGPDAGRVRLGDDQRGRVPDGVGGRRLLLWFCLRERARAEAV